MAILDRIPQSIVLAGSLACASFSIESSAGAAPPSTQPAAPVDEVRLVNGGFIKGEVLELMPGEYVIVKSLAGETRRFAWSEVASVERGETTTTGATPVGPVPVGEPEPVSIEPVEPEPQPEQSDIEGPTPAMPYLHIDVAGGRTMTLQRVTGRAVAVGSGGSASGVSFTRVCDSPCDRLVENSGSEFFMTGDKYSGSRPFTLTGDSSVYELRVKPRSKGMLIGGYVMISLAPAFTGLLAILPVVVNMKRSHAVGTWAIAGIGGVAMLGGGITLMAFGRTKVEVLPRTPSWIDSH